MKVSMIAIAVLAAVAPVLAAHAQDTSSPSTTTTAPPEVMDDDTVPVQEGNGQAPPPASEPAPPQLQMSSPTFQYAILKILHTPKDLNRPLTIV